MKEVQEKREDCADLGKAVAAEQGFYQQQRMEKAGIRTFAVT